MKCPCCHTKTESIDYGINNIKYKLICRQLVDHLFEYYTDDQWQFHTEEYGITQTPQSSILYLAKNNSYHDLPRIEAKDVCIFIEKYMKMIAFT
jgi:hypothetical protein